MKPRLQLFLLCAPLLVAGCYTQLRAPAEFGLEPRSDYDYWAEPYYVYEYYPAPWELYPGAQWWYATYWPCYHDYSVHEPVAVESESGHGWDRGPGSYVPTVGGRSGGGGGGGGGGGVVSAPTPVPDNPPNPPEPPKARTPDQPKAPSSDKKDPKPERSPWGR